MKKIFFIISCIAPCTTLKGDILKFHGDFNVKIDSNNVGLETLWVNTGQAQKMKKW